MEMERTLVLDLRLYVQHVRCAFIYFVNITYEYVCARMYFPFIKQYRYSNCIGICTFYFLHFFRVVYYETRPTITFCNLAVNSQ